MAENKNVGKYGEDLACEYLINNGYEILNRNYFCKFAEIDIIAREEDYIVFIEVKTRRNLKFGYPEESITNIKKNKIINASKHYITYNRLYKYNFRFDVVSIIINNKININLIKNAF